MPAELDPQGVYSIDDDKLMVVPDIKISKDVGYPSDWFNLNPNTKPKVKIAAIKDDGFSNLEQEVWARAKNLSLTPKHAAAYLYHYLKDVKMEECKKWESYGITIVGEGGTCSPFDLISVDVTDTLEYKGSKDPVTDVSDLHLLIYLVCIYRIIRASNQEHRKILIDRMNDQMREADPDAPQVLNLSSAFNTYQNWLNNPTYNKTIATIDMYFHRFSNHHLSILRIGTLGSKFRDCSALLSYLHVSTAIGLPRLDSLMLWMFTPQLKADADRMFSKLEEMQNEYSYFPYQVDLGLTERSAYSASVNPSIYFFCNSISCFFLNQRGMNARMLLEVNIPGNIFNSKIVRYVHSNRVNFKKNFYEGKEKKQKYLNLMKRPGSSGKIKTFQGNMEVDNEDEVDTGDINVDDFASILGQDDEEPEPVTADAGDWFIHMYNRDFTPTTGMSRYYNSLKDRIINPRSGTLAEYYKRTL